MLVGILLSSSCLTALATPVYTGALVKDAEDNDGHAGLLQLGIDATGSVDTIPAFDNQSASSEAVMLHRHCDDWVGRSYNFQETLVDIPVICDDVAYHQKDFSAYRARALNQTATCLLNKIPRVYAKMCEVCAHPSLQGRNHKEETVLGTEPPCTPRFTVLRHWVKGLIDETTRAATVENMQKATEWLEIEYEQYPENWEDGWDDDAYALRMDGAPYMDLNEDGNITKAEAAVYLKSAFVFTQVAPEALIKLHLTEEALSKWGQEEELQAWVAGGLYDAEWLRW